jgi:hypothetical protein
MPTLAGHIEEIGATLHVLVEPSPERIRALRKAGRNAHRSESILAVIDTGAKISAIDTRLVHRLGLANRGEVHIHTPSSGAGDRQIRPTHDAKITLGADTSTPLARTLLVVSVELASQGFFMLIGRDPLSDCRLSYDGRRKKFKLNYNFP